MKSKIIANFIAKDSSGFRTLDCNLVLENGSIYLDQKIIAPFVNKGKVIRQSWSWSNDYPLEKLLMEAKTESTNLANQMWGNK